MVTRKQREKEKKVMEVVYEEAKGIPKKEAEERLERAFDILFRAVGGEKWLAELQKKKQKGTPKSDAPLTGQDNML